MHARTEQAGESFFRDLVAHGLIIPSQVDGVVGRGARFEEVLSRFDALVLRSDDGQRAEAPTFPPVIERRILEKLHYLDTFPHLCGSVHSFFGDPRQALRLATRARQGERWGEELEQTDVVLAPAACYPLYPTLAGVLPPRGRLVTLMGWAYRHEPSREPTRMQSFRVREIIRVGEPDAVLAWRDAWHVRARELLEALGLPILSEVASDPFFGRGGMMLAQSQKAAKLKFEIQVPILDGAQPTAVCSFNLHQDHFGAAFDIRTADGQTAHSACLGFGMERVVMALFRHHGMETDDWPAAVRALLWP